MRAYCGQTREKGLIARLRDAGIGECTVRGELLSRKRDPWFYDNGAFRDWQAGAPFNVMRFSRDCRRMRMDVEAGKSAPDFVVLPDVVAGGSASLAFSSTWYHDVEGLRCYVAVQDGMTEAEVAAWIDEWDARDDADAEGEGLPIAGIFVGGTLEWKLATGATWVAFAHARGLRCHIGRVGTPDRVRWARSIGADSIDSCLPLMYVEHMDAFLAALAEPEVAPADPSPVPDADERPSDHVEQNDQPQRQEEDTTMTTSATQDRHFSRAKGTPAPQMELPIDGQAAPLRIWLEGDPVDADLFAGGGGASEGKRRATGKSPDIAVNHWPAAIAMHAVNHQDCQHYTCDVDDVSPIEATGGRRCRFLWASPTCIYFSRASGARLSPETVAIRGQANCIIPWIEQVRPDVILCENVAEQLGWGPVCFDHAVDCPGVDDASGKSCEGACNYGRPIPERRGEYFDEWVAEIRSHGYSVEWRVLKAWEYGSPTTRERLYCVMLADGSAYAWPEPTHVRPELVASTGKKPWRTAAEIIDWSIPCPSIFERRKPHVPATRRRLARGMRKFVLEAKQPFLMHLTHGDRHAPHSLAEPVRTVTGANRGEQALVAPYMIHHGNGERPGQGPRIYDINEPCRTVLGDGCKAKPVFAFLAKAYSERPTGGFNGGSALDVPIGALTAQDHHHLVAAHTVKFYGTSTGQPLDVPLDAVTGGGFKHGLVAASLLRYNGERRPGEAARGGSLDEPISTLDASNRHAVMAASLLRYNGKSIGQEVDAPIGTLDANDRYAVAEYAATGATEWNDIIAAKARRVYRFLVDEGVIGTWLDHENQLVWMPGTDLVIWDIGMRMLVPRELFRANGFTDEYVIDLIGPRGKRLTKTELVRLVGNSVCPDVAEALYRAALAGLPGFLGRGENRMAA